MSAPILEINAKHPHPRHIQRVVDLLAGGALVAYPTDTYYALGCDLTSRKGIEKLYSRAPSRGLSLRGRLRQSDTPVRRAH